MSVRSLPLESAYLHLSLWVVLLFQGGFAEQGRQHCLDPSKPVEFAVAVVVAAVVVAVAVVAVVLVNCFLISVQRHQIQFLILLWRQPQR